EANQKCNSGKFKFFLLDFYDSVKSSPTLEKIDNVKKADKIYPITNRPKYLEENIKFYKHFPSGYDLEIDYKHLPPILLLDFHTLNGILPLTKSRLDFIGKNSEVEGQNATVIFTNPLPEEYKYYESIGITEFQAIQIVLNFCVFEEQDKKVLKGFPYSVSLVPMQKNKQVDTWNINLMKQFDLEVICQERGYVFSNFNPFQGICGGIFSDYSLYSSLKLREYSDCIGFAWGLYFLSPKFDKKEVVINEFSSYSPQINAKYRNYKSELYFNPFKDVRPKRIWGCESPIELFVLQGLYLRKIFPEMQMCFYKDGSIFPNYYQMQESEIWISQNQLITAADFYFPEKKVAVFCDGKEFHNEAKDKAIAEKLNNIGVSSIRFTGKEINSSLSEVLDKIEKAII
ncbi:MAG TPA: DUF559 domain-containing protein, partial [Saprospiraceae bacterium]|nr:DUF559 domain-containing protein [Saprospiraceae bacterium]